MEGSIIPIRFESRAPRGLQSEFLRFDIKFEDLDMIIEFGEELRRGVPREIMLGAAIGIRDALSTSLKESATNVADTGRLHDSVVTDIEILGREKMLISGYYDSGYADFVDGGTGASLGRFVPGKQPRDTEYWNQAGSRISTKAGIMRGRTYGWHPGTPAQHIYADVESRLDDKLDQIQSTILYDFRMLPSTRRE